MSKLLTANFSRLLRDKVFWLGMAATIGFAVLIVLMNYFSHLKTDYTPILDDYFFGSALVAIFAIPVFSSLFLGTEYSDGTIRNKLVAGHTRTAVYLSNYVIVAVAGMLMCLGFIAAVSLVGIPLLGPLQSSIDLILMLLLGNIMIIMALSAILTLASMLIQNKAAAAIVCILCTFAMFAGALIIMERLSAPEFYDNYIIDEVGGITTVTMPYPQYLSGRVRAAYQFILDLLPTGQGLQIANMTAIHLWQMPLYSVLVALVATAGGILFFRGKDLK